MEEILLSELQGQVLALTEIVGALIVSMPQHQASLAELDLRIAKDAVDGQLKEEQNQQQRDVLRSELSVLNSYVGLLSAKSSG